MTAARGARTLGLALIAACAAPGGVPVARVTIAPPPASRPSAPTEAASPDAAPSAPRAATVLRAAGDAPQGLAGAWRDEETNHVFVVRVDQGAASVVSAIDEDDGERFAILKTRFDGGTLTWSYRVTSTGVRVTYRTVSLDGDTLRCTWTNSNGAADDEVLVRVR